jgi:hypothetical protein
MTDRVYNDRRATLPPVTLALEELQCVTACSATAELGKGVLPDAPTAWRLRGRLHHCYQYDRVPMNIRVLMNMKIYGRHDCWLTAAASCSVASSVFASDPAGASTP